MFGTTTTYTYSGNLLMEMHRSGRTLQFVYDAGGTALGFKAKETGTMYYYVRNAQGDIDRIVDANGSNRAQYSYDAWGFVVSQSSNDTYAAMNPLRYRGYMYDAETGWYFLQTRYYDPMVKRFLNADSLFVAGDALTGSNMYAYCNGNPVMFSDPTGRAGELNAFVNVAFAAVIALMLEIPTTILNLGSAIDTLISEGFDIDSWYDVAYTLYGEDRYKESYLVGQDCVATLIKNRMSHPRYEHHNYGSYSDVVKRSEQFHGYQGGINALKKGDISIDQLVNALRVSYRLNMGLHINSHGLTRDHILFAADGDYPSGFLAGTKIDGGANDFYKHEGWVMFT